MKADLVRKVKPPRPMTAGWNRPMTNNLLQRQDGTESRVSRTKPPMNLASSYSSLNKHFGALTKAVSQNELGQMKRNAVQKRYSSNQDLTLVASNSSFAARNHKSLAGTQTNATSANNLQMQLVQKAAQSNKFDGIQNSRNAYAAMSKSQKFEQTYSRNHLNQSHKSFNPQTNESSSA